MVANSLSKQPLPETSPWLTGNFAPVSKEFKNFELEVQGAVPKSLNGSFLRNGPNPVFAPTPYHWFDGDGMIHAITLKDGKASYTNRFVATEGFQNERTVGKLLYGGLLAGGPFKNAANTSIVQHHGKTLAAWEGGLPHEINLSTLETRGLYDFENQWSAPFTAHPKTDPVTGELIFFGDEGSPAQLCYGVLNAQGKLTHSCTIKLPNSVMMHDFAITENYSVFLDLPVLYKKEGLQYAPSAGARIGVLPRHGASSDVRWFNITPCWIYHVMGAFEDGNTVVLRASKHESWPSGITSLVEWRLNLSTGAALEKVIDATPMEFPVVNPRIVGRQHRFGYGALAGRSMASGFAKYDLTNGTKKIYDFGAGKSGGETFFTPTENSPLNCQTHSLTEDDGYLLSIVYDEAENSSDFIIVDAKNLDLLASVRLPQRVPFGFHGLWTSIE
jgi:carotenoid cleavage dioxygenase-like enzyme